jgi:Flp pilus assembly protein TadB
MTADRAANAVSTQQASTATLVRLAGEQLSRLIRDELALARAEIAAKASGIGVGLGRFSGARLVALYGVGALLAAAVIALALVIPAWLAAVTVAVATFVVAAVLTLLGRRAVRRVGSQPRRSEPWRGSVAGASRSDGPRGRGKQ